MKRNAREGTYRHSQNKAYRFLYTVGIQSVRILKRLNRRLRRFFRPVAELLKHIYHKLVDRRLQSIRNECKSIRTGFSIAGKRVKTAKQRGLGCCLAECAKVTGKSVVRHRKILFGAVNILAPVAAVLVLIWTVQFWNNQNFGLVLAYDGQEIATIQDEQVFEQAAEMVNSRLVSGVAADNKMNLSPSYTLAVVNGARFATPNILCDRLIEKSGDVIEEATGLYMDGNLLGVVRDYSALQNSLNEMLKEAVGDDKNAEASFVQDLELINGLYPTESIIGMDTMDDILHQTTMEDAYYTV